LLPIGLRLKQFAVGFIITASLCAAVEFTEALLRAAELIINPHFGWSSLGTMFFWDVKSVVTEELIFRGAILLIIFERLGKRSGLWLSALTFGIYH